MLETSNSFNIESIRDFSVSEISSKVKELLETNLGYVRVKGEISGLKIAASGHGYFNLKDNLAILGCTCWRHTLSKIKFSPQDGIEVVATGKITSYEGQSKYQLSVTNLEPAGAGAMMQILKERRDRLEKEGLFDKSRKKSIPFMPNKIGVITSITGAVIKDIIHRISERFPTNLLIWPVNVQGDTSAKEISVALDGFNQLEKKDRPDLIIVARGGGSIEDLWSFNEEIVVRSVVKSEIPVISAVGHETDYTLIDLAADLRAPTPTAAAEFAVPVAADLKNMVNLYYNKLFTRISTLIRYKEQVISGYERILKYPINYIDSAEQRLDEIGFRLYEALPNLIKFKANKIEQFTLERINPNKIIDYKLLQLTHQSDYLNSMIRKILNEFEQRFNLNSQLLTSLDYHNVLKRGFAVIKAKDGRILSSKIEASMNDKFDIKFLDGEIHVQKL